MADNISQEKKEIIDQAINTYAKLLKEFPKNAAEDFIYDSSTLAKIGRAGDALNKMASLLKGQQTSPDETGKDTLRDAHDVLSRLMAELPKNPVDDFSYDRAVHQLVEDARETLEKLSRIIV